jgi:dual specificity phosphatase 12
MSESTPLVERCHLDLDDGMSEDLVLKLPEAVAFINRGLNQNSEAVILVHSFDLTRICIVACAYCKLFVNF